MTPTCYETLIAELAGALALDPQALVQSQELCLCGTTIGLQHDDLQDGVRYVCAIGNLPDDPSAATALARELLRANHFGRGTAGLTLGLQQDGRKIVLTGCTVAQAGAQALVQDIVLLATFADAWRAAAEQPLLAQELDASPSRSAALTV